MTTVVLSQSESIAATHLDGRTTVKVSCTQVVAAGMIHLSVTLTTLKTIDAVLDIQTTSSSPKTAAYGPEMIAVSGAIVGFTLQAVGAGTTLGFDLVCLGF